MAQRFDNDRTIIQNKNNDLLFDDNRLIDDDDNSDGDDDDFEDVFEHLFDIQSIDSMKSITKTKHQSFIDQNDCDSSSIESNNQNNQNLKLNIQKRRRRKARNVIKYSTISFIVITYIYSCRYQLNHFNYFHLINLNNNLEKRWKFLLENYTTNDNILSNLFHSFITTLINNLTNYSSIQPKFNYNFIFSIILFTFVLSISLFVLLLLLSTLLLPPKNYIRFKGQKILIKSHSRLSELNNSSLSISIIYLLVPWRLISRLWGWLNQLRLPPIIRAPIYRWYSRTFDCNLQEIKDQNLRNYTNLSEFFRRSLNPYYRPIDYDCDLVSPADGTIVQFEMIPINGGMIGDCKGINYSIENFLGFNDYADILNDLNYDWSLPAAKLQQQKRLFSCVIYLAPGDYHRFHSPADWIITNRRHFIGNLLSVRPSFVSKISNLFAINERAVYYGHWKYGFFSMAAIGATNVGSISVFCDQELKTNQFHMNNRNYCEEKFFNRKLLQQKGELFGEFNLGSTIVLIFEAPVDMINLSQKSSKMKRIHYGQSLVFN